MIEFTPDIRLTPQAYEDALSQARAEGRREGIAEAEDLASAMYQLLDDMGGKGHSVCGAVKAQARIAIEPFLNEDRTAEGLMSLQEARAIIWDCDHLHRPGGLNPYRALATPAGKER